MSDPFYVTLPPKPPEPEERSCSTCGHWRLWNGCRYKGSNAAKVQKHPQDLAAQEIPDTDWLTLIMSNAGCPGWVKR